jgi:hypothetical protein
MPINPRLTLLTQTKVLYQKAKKQESMFRQCSNEGSLAKAFVQHTVSKAKTRQILTSKLLWQQNKPCV